MFKSLIAFLILTMVFSVGIKVFASLKLKEKWELTKVVGYAILCALLSLAALSVVVILF